MKTPCHKDYVFCKHTEKDAYGTVYCNKEDGGWMCSSIYLPKTKIIEGTPEIEQVSVV